MTMGEIRIRLDGEKRRMRKPFLPGMVLAAGLVVVMCLLAMSMFDWPVLG
jgi:hypothetical protein